jgi:hypothetical protein
MLEPPFIDFEAASWAAADSYVVREDAHLSEPRSRASP